MQVYNVVQSYIMIPEISAKTNNKQVVYCVIFNKQLNYKHNYKQ